MDEELTATEAGHLLGVSSSRVRQLIGEGRLPAGRFGRSLVVRRRDIDLLVVQLVQEAPRKRGPKPNAIRGAVPTEEAQG